MVGREMFGDLPEFWNPDLPVNGSYEELIAAGERQAHNLMEHAHRRGMECSVYADLTQFPPEFSPLLKGAQKVHQLGELLVVPGPETAVDDPQYSELCLTVLRAAINTYPEADLVTLGMPEWRQWTRVYEDAWRTLDAKYGISSISSLKEVLDLAEHSKWPEGVRQPLAKQCRCAAGVARVQALRCRTVEGRRAKASKARSANTAPPWNVADAPGASQSG